MVHDDDPLYEVKTAYEHYQIIDTNYNGRPARVLFSGHKTAAQSAIARDDNPELPFDYNQRFMEIIEQLQPTHILLVGGGGFSLPVVLQERLPKVRIDVAEIDSELQTIAEQFFGLKRRPELRVYGQDGLSFLESSDTLYDLILIDAFTHAAIPKELSTYRAARAVYHRLLPNGLVAINIIATYRGRRSHVLRKQCAAYQQVFGNSMLYPAGKVLAEWEAQNFILTAQKSDKKITPGIHAEAILPPNQAFPDDTDLLD